ncbi:unannotated protein [freshwater metagenome]|uniref:Unannotated protein n=1 Tax=freshwater metagenome TaxID=449393 RepID=A0A6J6VM62_9ZZZZ
MWRQQLSGLRVDTSLGLMTIRTLHASSTCRWRVVRNVARLCKQQLILQPNSEVLLWLLPETRTAMFAIIHRPTARKSFLLEPPMPRVGGRSIQTSVTELMYMRQAETSMQVATLASIRCRMLVFVNQVARLTPIAKERRWQRPIFRDCSLDSFLLSRL